ncbi:glutamyl-tRNA reductase [Pseudogracilibacillus auburnensis]|uniref:Glutamyl-tRNA reductase n=1 Tax=Pseudogracilibacillus auburnensis TaxID=1494959 RepID=A0A2V3VYE4_9BACI|nr:glutamyl-tRNA reductase [Pseudogracilibacillus auburnensis]MBO1002613.1 glutamyl-tRNA reductase [Pseudogracilibacillus auburnensis]PXW86636.1 glutamyl-tRNA reductase [Pseudogracilibacillus auburnensis]
MYILQVGFNYKTTPIEIREKLAFSESTIEDAIVELNKRKSILENVILSTCNRTEIYAVVDQIHTGRYYIKQFLSDWFHIPMEEFSSYLQIVENDGAIEHLLRVSVGLNSMVLGETQILGQIRDAFLTAQQMETTGTIFNELFKRAITFAKRAHKETAIGEHAVSVSYAAVELSKKIFGEISDKHVVIYGAGEMGELAVKNLYGAGVKKITVVNRTLERAEKLAKQFNANAATANELSSILKKADILISSTAAKDPVLTKADLIPIQKDRKGKPLFLVDIAVPRDLDAKIGELDSVFLYDIDDLQHIVDQNLAERKKAAEVIELQVEKEIVEFKDWVITLGVVPVIRALREKALTIQGETFASIKRKIPDLTEREQKVIRKHTKSIINQLLKEPIIQAKEMAGKKESDKLLALFVDVFGIDDDVKKEVEKRSNKTKAIVTDLKKNNVSFPFTN